MTIEKLCNGLYLVTDRRSGLRGLYNADGSYRSGDLSRVSRSFILASGK